MSGFSSFGSPPDPELLSELSTALQWLDNVETPLRLKDLCRRKILNTLSVKNRFESPALGLPESLQKYVLYKGIDHVDGLAVKKE